MEKRPTNLTQTKNIYRMKNSFYLLAFILGTTLQVTAQQGILTPKNNPADHKLVESETYEMAWYMLNGDQRMDVGQVRTEIQEKGDKILVRTSVDMKRATSAWVDTTIVKANTFEPLYHSSYNQQRDMVLQFSEEVTGYHLDKASGNRKEITVPVDGPFFDSNFYPQLIRWLPLEEGYSTTMAIFDYNPKSEIGIMAATIKNTEETTLDIDGITTRVFKVTATDDISNNTATSTYYIAVDSRKMVKQEIEVGGRKMVMERIH